MKCGHFEWSANATINEDASRKTRRIKRVPGRHLRTLRRVPCPVRHHAGSAARASRACASRGRNPRVSPAARPPAGAAFRSRHRRRRLAGPFLRGRVSARWIIDCATGVKPAMSPGQWIHTVGAGLVWTPRASPCSPASWMSRVPRGDARQFDDLAELDRFAALPVAAAWGEAFAERRGRIADVARAEWCPCVARREPPRRAFGGRRRDSPGSARSKTRASPLWTAPALPPPSPPPRLRCHVQRRLDRRAVRG